MKLKKDLVVMNNSLVTAAYHFTLNEKRLIWCAMKKIPTGVIVQENTPFFITRDDFIAVGADEKNIARDIREAIRLLSTRRVRYLTPTGEADIAWISKSFRFDSEAESKLRELYPNEEDYLEYINKLKSLNWADDLNMKKNENDDGIIAYVVFHKDMLPLLSDLKANFTSIMFSDVKDFSSFYTYRFYELFMQYFDKKSGKGWILIDIEKIKYMTVLKDKYKLFTDFKKRVLDPSVNEINEKSPLLVEYSMIKEGRKFTKIKFTFQRKITETQNNDNENAEVSTNISISLTSLFDGLSDRERQNVKARVDEYISHLESKGETVSDYHRQNIVKKAVAERWGLDSLEKQERKQEERRKKAEAEARQAEAEQQEREAKKANDDLILEQVCDYWRSLDDDTRTNNASTEMMVKLTPATTTKSETTSSSPDSSFSKDELLIIEKFKHLSKPDQNLIIDFMGSILETNDNKKGEFLIKQLQKYAQNENFEPIYSTSLFRQAFFEAMKFFI